MLGDDMRQYILLAVIAFVAVGCSSTQRQSSYTLLVIKGKNDAYFNVGKVNKSIVKRCFKKKNPDYDQMAKFPSIAIGIGTVFIEANGIVKKIEVWGWRNADKSWAFTFYGVLPEIAGVADTQEECIRRITEILEKGPSNKEFKATGKSAP